MLIDKEELLKSLPEESPLWDENDFWDEGYNFCLKEITLIIKEFGKEEEEEDEV